MLKIMRSHKFFTVFLLSAVTIMIIITFVFWGIGPKDSPSDIVVARIGKEKITLQEYWRAYDNTERYYREIYKNNEEEFKKLNLKDKVLNDLINSRVLMIAAKTAGIKVTEDELREAIMSNPLFQKNGVFDRGVYMRALRLNRMTPKEYENSLSKEMILNKIYLLIGETTELSSKDIEILESMKGVEGQLAQAILSAKRELVVKAYIDGLKRQMKIKVNRDLIS